MSLDLALDQLGDAAEIRVTGTVQGVGFRPTVWRLATEEGLIGEVLNDGEGVLIRAGGGAAAIARFVTRLTHEAPPLSRIESIRVRGLAEPLDTDQLHSEFRIVASIGGDARTRVTADAATCAACMAELSDPHERRFGYPFVNCTHCGPRFSIVTRVPYDRANTTMAAFPMCAACRAEYEDSADRRFHAQPIACAECGPRIWLESLNPAGAGAGAALAREPADALAQAAEALRAGRIVAIRGLGGFHLACDASNSAAITRLRERKHRYGKPLALMATDAAMVRRYCGMSPLEQTLFESVEAPIVVLDEDGPERLPDELAPRLDALGWMQPYTPLHALLMARVGRPLVMTSGNVSDEPQVTGLDDARARLSNIADVALMHDREIANRIDDSVVRVMAGHPRFIRRARGHAPGAIRLPAGFAAAEPVLALGAEQKATFCLLIDGAAVLSQHQGDLEDPSTFDDYERNLALYTDMYDYRPRVLAADLHPEYLSTKLAQKLAGAQGIALIQVQHHHAHIAGCMAERGVALDDPPVLGIALDGVGLGTDGTIWGGEFLLTHYHRCERLASLTPVALAGGVRAILEPWRSLYAQIVAAIGWAELSRRFARLDLVRALSQKPLGVIDQMLARGINAPLASSCGRLFDAVAAALGFCSERVQYQAQAAMELEAAAERSTLAADDSGYPFAIELDAAAALHQLNPAPMWTALFEDLERGDPIELVAARFHAGLALAIARMVETLAESITPRFSTVVLSGGCFQNRRLLESVSQQVSARGFTCLTNLSTPANDGGIALGQAVVAAAMRLRASEE